MSQTPAAMAARTREIAEAHLALEGPLLPILHALQHEFGHIPKAVLPVIADVLNLSRAEVWGVMSFYPDFREEPAGRTVLKLCRAEACQAQGGDRLSAHARARLGVDWHGTTPDGRVTVEPVFCLGLCASGPAAMVGDRLVGRLDEARLEAILQDATA